VSTTSDESAVSRPPLPTSPKNTEVSTADTTFSTPDSAYDVLEVGTGADYACALLRDRTVACWGNNWLGQLGSYDLVAFGGDPTDGSCFSWVEPYLEECVQSRFVDDRASATVVTKYITPTREQANQTLVRRRVPGVSNVKKIFVGEYGACALGMNGRVKCWGTYGDQSNFTVVTREETGSLVRILPREIEGLSDVVDLALGYPSCAVLGSGRVVCWSLGYALGGIYWKKIWQKRFPGMNVDDPQTPEEIPGITNAVTITALVEKTVSRGWAAYTTPFCAVLRDSTARCWPQPHGLLKKSSYSALEGIDNSDFIENLSTLGISRDDFSADKPILSCALNSQFLNCDPVLYTYGLRTFDCSAASSWLETNYDAEYLSRLRAGFTEEEFNDYLDLMPRDNELYDDWRWRNRVGSLGAERFETLTSKLRGFDFSDILRPMPDCREILEPLRNIRQIIAPKSCICENMWEVCVVDTSNRLSCASSIIGRANLANLSLISASVGFKKLELGQHVRSNEGNVLACWLDDQSRLLCNGGLNSPTYPQPETLATRGFLGSTYFSDHVHVANLDEPVRTFSMYDSSVCALTFSDDVYCWGKNGRVGSPGSVNHSRFIFD